MRVFVLGWAHPTSLLRKPWSGRCDGGIRRAARAAAIALIPVRGGNGEMERLAALGHFTPPTLAQLEAALDRCLGLPAAVAADLWTWTAWGGRGRRATNAARAASSAYGG